MLCAHYYDNDYSVRDVLALRCAWHNIAHKQVSIDQAQLIVFGDVDSNNYLKRMRELNEMQDFLLEFANAGGRILALGNSALILGLDEIGLLNTSVTDSSVHSKQITKDPFFSIVAGVPMGMSFFNRSFLTKVGNIILALFDSSFLAYNPQIADFLIGTHSKLDDTLEILARDKIHEDKHPKTKKLDCRHVEKLCGRLREKLVVVNDGENDVTVGALEHILQSENSVARIPHDVTSPLFHAALRNASKSGCAIFEFDSHDASILLPYIDPTLVIAGSHQIETTAPLIMRSDCFAPSQSRATTYSVGCANADFVMQNLSPNPYVSFRVEHNDFFAQVNTLVRGAHNASGLMAAFCAGYHVIGDDEFVAMRLASYSNSQDVQYRGKYISIQNANNRSQAENAICSISKGLAQTDILLTADAGNDYSWIYQVDFKPLRNALKIYVSGSNCLDVAVRMKYCGIYNLSVYEDTLEAISAFLNGNGMTGAALLSRQTIELMKRNKIL